MIFWKKKEKEFEVPEGMMIVSYDALKGYFSECDNVVPDYSLKAHYRSCLEEAVDQEWKRRLVPIVRDALTKKK